jgi:hypothetical protein
MSAERATSEKTLKAIPKFAKKIRGSSKMPSDGIEFNNID